MWERVRRRRALTRGTAIGVDVREGRFLELCSIPDGGGCVGDTKLGEDDGDLGRI